MTFARERDQWFWVCCGREAVDLSRACSARAHQEGRPDIAAIWDRWAKRCAADPSKTLKVRLPQEYVERRINAPRYFNRPYWWEER